MTLFENGKNEGLYKFDHTALMNIPMYVCILIYLFVISIAELLVNILCFFY